MKKNEQNDFSCFFCKSKQSLYAITSEINELIFKPNSSNNQNKIFSIFNDIFINIPSTNEKIFYICECCLNISMNMHFFGTEKIETNFNNDFIVSSNSSFLHLLEIYTCINRIKLEINIQIFKKIKNLFDYINSNSKSFVSQIGNKYFISLINQLNTLIGLLRDIIYSNDYSNKIEVNFINSIKDYTNQIIERINSYKLLNYPNLDINTNFFPYSGFSMFQSFENIKNIEKNKNMLKELILEYNKLLNSN